MKVLAINGSPRLVGNTSHILTHLLDNFEKEGFETDYIQIYEDHLIPCNACFSCEIRGDGRCVNEDDKMNEYVDRMRAADVIILSSPSYYGTCTGQMKIFLERAGFCLSTGDKGLKGKIGLAYTVQERDGGITVFNELVSWMLKNELIVIGSNPLPIFNGRDPNDWEEDKKALKGLNGLVENVISLIEKF